MVGSMGEIFYFGEGLAFETAGKEISVSWRDVGVMRPVGRLARNPLAIGGWHGRRVENEEREVKGGKKTIKQRVR